MKTKPKTGCCCTSCSNSGVTVQDATALNGSTKRLCRSCRVSVMVSRFMAGWRPTRHDSAIIPA